MSRNNPQARNPSISRLSLTLEESGHGTIFEDLVDGFRQQRGDGKHLEVVETFLGLREGIGGDDFFRTALAEAFARRVGENTVGTGDDHGFCAGFLEHPDRAGDGAAGVDHVIEQDAVLAIHIADHTIGDHLVGDIHAAGLVDEGHGRIAEGIGPLFGDLHAAGVRGDDAEILHGVLRFDVVGEDRHGVHVIHGAVEEALDLVGVQIHRNDAISAGGGEQVGDQASGDGFAAAVLLILAGVGVEGEDRGDALGGTTLKRINHDELFHQPLIQRLGVGLQDEAIGAADGLLEANEDFPVGKISGGGWGDLNAEFAGYGLGEFRVSAPSEQHHVLVGLLPVGSHGVRNQPSWLGFFVFGV